MARLDSELIDAHVSWGEFKKLEPELAAFGDGRLRLPPAYLATVRKNGAPRVHPVTPIVAASALFLFMEPASPKRRDLRELGWYALHNGVPDTGGSGGEFLITGKGFPVTDTRLRVIATDAASYEPPSTTSCSSCGSPRHVAMVTATFLFRRTAVGRSHDRGWRRPPVASYDRIVAYDEELAERIRELLDDERWLTEQKMFGGLAFLIGGNIAVAASGQGGVLVRVDPERSEKLLATTNARPMEMRGRLMHGWLRVDTEDVRTKRQLAKWVKLGTTFARSLPAKR